MEHKKIIIKALKHFIRYNKNREEIFLNKRWISGLCAYIGKYAQRFTPTGDLYYKITKEFNELVNPYTNGTWISSKGRVTKRRLYVAQVIINKLEKELKNVHQLSN